LGQLQRRDLLRFVATRAKTLTEANSILSSVTEWYAFPKSLQVTTVPDVSIRGQVTSVIGLRLPLVRHLE